MLLQQCNIGTSRPKRWSALAVTNESFNKCNTNITKLFRIIFKDVY